LLAAGFLSLAPGSSSTAAAVARDQKPVARNKPGKTQGVIPDLSKQFKPGYSLMNKGRFP
jgi:hypothetical protein